ncbi:MAG: transcription antitermination factor NusB [Betaproteobacteria bacterium]|nr:transcription antitermination factor NusB [Betaproteobacteria bacterium]
MKAARSRSREFALQGLYRWLLARASAAEIARDIELFRGFDKCDALYFRDVLEGAIHDAAAIEVELAPCVDRPLDKISPIERAILLIAGCEFLRHPEVPYRVVINEAVELAKVYGGNDGHKYVNGVLDKLAAALREPEVREQRASMT